MKRISLLILSINFIIVQIVFSDVEISYDFNHNGGNIEGFFKYENRQTQYFWNNDVLPIVAVGYSLSSKPRSIYNDNYQILGIDNDGLTQYRYLYPRGERNSVMPGETETYGGGSDVTLYLANIDSTLCPYPRYPHIVLKEEPWYGLKYPDTYSYAPPLTSDSIDALGVVIGQSDYYDPLAWRANDDADLLASEDQHPTQIWIGMPHIKAGMSINDSKDPSDVYSKGINDAIGNIQDVRGSYIAPNSPTGDGVQYSHTKGDGPGGLMLSMAASWGQEFFGMDKRVPFAIGSKESWLCVFWDSLYTSSGVFPEWGYAGSDPTYGGGHCQTDPYQITTDVNIDISYQARPDFMDHDNSMKEYYPGVNCDGSMKTNIINATITFYNVMSANFYDYLSASRSHRLDDFAENSADQFSRLRLSAYAYNQGRNRTEFYNMRFCGIRNEMLASKNLSNTHGIIGGFEYAPRIVDLVRRIGNSDNVYDWGIGWGDIEDFCADLRKFHYANDIPTDAKWSEMLNDMKNAFDKMKGKAPTENLDSEKISFRYNWLTMLRIMKSYLPNPGSRLPKGAAFYSAKSGGDSKLNGYGAYQPQYNFSGLDIDYESQGPFPDTNWAAEIYWVEPSYTFPSLEKGFPVTGSYKNNLEFRITANILDDGTGTGNLTARYCVSPGDPATGGHSLWRDGDNTGNAPMAPVPVDWIEMEDIGASENPVGGRRYSAIFDASGIENENRRIYIEANDNSGYRTISWVDVFFEDDGLKDLIIESSLPDGSSFIGDTTIYLTVKDEDGNDLSAAKIYYTLDGSDPSDMSTLYTGSIFLSGSAGDTFTIKAYTVASGYSSGEGEWNYFQNAMVAWIKATPDSGEVYSDQLEITLTSNTDSIYYTIDGSDPETNGILYTGPFIITDAVTTVTGYAFGKKFTPATGVWKYYKESDTAWVDSDVADGSTYGDSLVVTLSTNGEKIYFTLDGSDPTTSDSLYSGPIILTGGDVTIKALAVGNLMEDGTGEWTYYQVSLPKVIIDPGSQSFEESISVTLSVPGWKNAKIFYTLDRSLPDDKSLEYTNTPIHITATTTVYAIAYAENALPSEISSETYILVGNINDAWYIDESGDGAIDKVEMFSAIKTDSLPREIMLINPFDSNDTSIVSSSDIDWKNGNPISKTIVAKIVPPFPYTGSTYFEEDLFGSITKGNFSKRTFLIKDKVAPVIDKAVFSPGSIRDIETLERYDDTLIVVFSELVSGFTGDTSSYFNLIDQGGSNYYFDLIQNKSKGNSVTFIIPEEGIHGVDYPVTDDSIWIDTSYSIKDINGNPQIVSDNRYAPLEVLPQPLNVILKVLSPIKATNKELTSDILENVSESKLAEIVDGGGAIVSVNFLSDLTKVEDRINCNIKVFDPVGNIVAYGSTEDRSDENIKMGFSNNTTSKKNSTYLIIYWNGCNQKGRSVGSGSYVADLLISLEDMKVSKKVTLSVKK